MLKKKKCYVAVQDGVGLDVSKAGFNSVCNWYGFSKNGNVAYTDIPSKGAWDCTEWALM